MSIALPETLAARLDDYVRQGWAADSQEAIIEALCRFLDSHDPKWMEAQIQEDVRWGLHGRD